MLQILILISIIVGLLFILYSIFLFKRDGGQSQGYNFDAENIIQAIDKSVSEVDNAMEEFSKLSEGVFDEMNQKYQELLYLYSLVDDKHKKITQSAIDVNTDQVLKPRNPEPSEASKVVYMQQPEPVAEEYATPMYRDAPEDDPEEQISDESVAGYYSDNIPVGIKYEEIFQLHSDGFDSSEIARKLGIGKGEVKLILELGKARG